MQSDLEFTVDVQSIKHLVEKYTAHRSSYIGSTSLFNETDVRAEYIDPFLKALGWDVSNQAGRPMRLREVERETRVNVQNHTKRPDYELKLGAERKLFVEAKRPSVSIELARDPALQVRSYGYSGNLLASVLTNFEYLIIYDTTVEPISTDDPEVAQFRSFRYDEYVDRIHEIAELISRRTIYSGHFDELFQEATLNRPEERIGAKFLKTLTDWRLRLAQELHAADPALDAYALDDIAQRFILRVLFLRMCEDRGIHTYERLLGVAQQNDWSAFIELLAQSDERYDTDLFAAANDPLRTAGGLALSTATVAQIIESLYYPVVPYKFAVIEPEFLGSVYERFLSDQVTLNEAREVILEPKPEHLDRDVVPTPPPIIESILEDGLGDELRAAPYDELIQRNILDPACGSGGFLVGAYNILMESAIISLVREGRTADYIEGPQGPQLSFEHKRRLLLGCIYGVDRDYAAVEVAKFSLLIKLLEGETEASLPPGNHILPNLRDNVVVGDTLIDSDEADANYDDMIGVPHDWGQVMPDQYDYIVGNPPYLKTESIVNFEPAEYEIYGRIYSSAYKQYDKYYLFIERAIERLLKAGGRFCMIVSRKFAHIESGKKLRSLLSTKSTVDYILDFGSAQLFSNKLTYVCVLRFTKAQPTNDVPFSYEWIADPSEWIRRQGGGANPLTLPRSIVSGDQPWVLPSSADEAILLQRMLNNTVPLGHIADVFNGIQTSRNAVYVIKDWIDHGDHIEFTRDGHNWSVEKDVLRNYFDDSSGELRTFYPLPPPVYVLFPYRVFPTEASYGFQIIPPAEMEVSYPLAWAYLNFYRESLSKRNLGAAGNHVWYQYGRTQAIASFAERPKLIVGVLSKGDKYVYDDGNVLLASGGTAGECAIAPFRNGSTEYDLHFLQALLSTKAAEYFCRKRGSPFQGDDWYARGTAVLSDLPIPFIDFSKDNERLAAHNQIADRARELNVLYARLSAEVGRRAEMTKYRIRNLTARMHSQVHKLYGVERVIRSITLPK